MIYVLSTSRSVLPSHCLDDVCFLDLLGISLLDFRIDEDMLQDSKYIILTSKNSIRSILKHKLVSVLLQKQAIVIGNSTGQQWIEQGGRVLFSPNVPCNGKKLAQMLIRHKTKDISGATILYPCARDRLTDFSSLLGGLCHVVDVIVYESYERRMNCDAKDFIDSVPENSIFIFGSPNIYKAFIKNYGWRDDWVAISLGSTTFSYFDANIRKVNANGNFKDALNLARNLTFANIGD